MHDPVLTGRARVLLGTWVLICIVVVGGAVLAAAVVHDRRTADRVREADATAALAVGELSESIGRTTARLEGARGIVSPDGTISDLQFEAFAAGLAVAPSVVATALDLVVEDVDRERLEERRGIEIVDLGPDGEMRRAPSRPVYVPVVAIVPAGPETERVLGFDVLGDPDREDVIRRAWSTGVAAVSDPVALTTGDDGFLVVQPLLDHGVDGGSAAVDLADPGDAAGPADRADPDRPPRTVGFIVVAYGSEALLGELSQRTGVSIVRIDLDDEVLHALAGDERRPTRSATADGAGVTWTVHVMAPPGAALWLPVGIVVVSIVLAGLFGELIRRSGRYQRDLELWNRRVERERGRAEALRRLTDQLAASDTVEAVARAFLDQAPILARARWAHIEIEDDHGQQLVSMEVGEADPSDRTTVVLRSGGDDQGTLALQPADGVLDDDDLAMRVSAISVTAAAVARTKRRQADSELAQSLQMMLLPRLPDHAAVGEVCGEYRPMLTASVGGDWFDVVDTTSGSAYLVGDVVGKGVRAAGAMGNLRIATRMVAEHDRPDRIIAGLDAVAADVPDAFLTTVAVVAADQRTGELRCSRAGHPPPLLIASDGSVCWLDGGLGPPLGIADAEHDRWSATVAWHGPARLLMYTDGLVERRDRTIDVGLDRLAVVAARHIALSLEEFCSLVVDEMLGEEHQTDDVAVLGVDLPAPGVRP